MNALDLARKAQKEIREAEAQLVRFVCPSGHWVEVPSGSAAFCGPCKKPMKPMEVSK